MPGPTVRSDIVEVYVFRRAPGTITTGSVASGSSVPVQSQGLLAVEFLQLRRAKGLMIGGWHPVMGHVEEGETATQAAIRELAEETTYGPKRDVIGLWQLEPINSYFIASIDTIILSPGFAVEVAPGSEPVIDDSHDAVRWIGRDQADRAFLWPGQRLAAEHIVRDILPPHSLMGPRLKIEL